MKMSNKNRNADKKPLMYIVQPDYVEMQSSMQDILIKKRKTPEPPQEELVKPEPPEHAEKQADQPAAASPAEEKEHDKQTLPPQSQSEEAALHEEQTQEQDVSEPAKAEKEPEAVHNAEPEEKVPPKRVKKPMSRMSIIEKIDFLTKLPHNMPRALCLIEANGKTYRGVIVGRKNDAIYLRTTSNGAPTELAIEDITSLHPLGF
ncbi:spore coat CotO family protein [Bacillus sp. YC2]|nr:spore coat CotO family protein [Bacillus sp. YC2]